MSGVDITATTCNKTKKLQHGVNTRGLGLWCLMPLSTTIQIYCDSDLLTEETGVHVENHRPAASH
jgi:hypothetical protein